MCGVSAKSPSSSAIMSSNRAQVAERYGRAGCSLMFTVNSSAGGPVLRRNAPRSEIRRHKNHVGRENRKSRGRLPATTKSQREGLAGQGEEGNDEYYQILLCGMRP